jgi:syntaxin 16
VLEQGTILDRIDYNIEQAHKDTKQAVVHLEKTKEIEKSGCARGVIICMSVTILVLVLLMVMKHS